MRNVDVSDAEAQFDALLDEAARGETLVITREGRPIARIVPEGQERQKEVDQPIAASRPEGHRY